MPWVCRWAARISGTTLLGAQRMDPSSYLWFQPLPRQDISAASPRSAAQRACPACRAVKGAHGGGVERLLWRGAGALPWDRESGVRWGARNPMLHTRRPWSAPAAAAANSTCVKTAATAKATMPVHMYLLRALGAQQNGERRSKFCRITAGRARGMSLRACVK